MSSKRDIICLSTHYWNDFWFRKQQFMSRFSAMGYRVLYVQPSFSMVRRSDKPNVADNRFFFSHSETISDGVYSFSPPRFLPKPNTPLSSWFSYHWHSELVAKQAKKLGMADATLWVYRPEFAVGLRRIPHNKLVFDLVDDVAAYNPQPSQYRFVTNCVERLIEKSDLLVVTSSTLLDRYKARARKCILVPNGYDERLFNGEPQPVPSDLQRIPKPVAGFVGVLFGFLDYDLLYETAQKLPDVSFVFVGPVERSGMKGVNRLRTLSNTYFLSSKPREEIPNYVSNFDVCLNPFRIDDVSRAVSPLKVYEYLACGKPVVSTPMEGLARDEAGKWIKFAGTTEFASALQASLANRPPSGRDPECIKASRAFSWTSRFNELKSHIAYL